MATYNSACESRIKLYREFQAQLRHTRKQASKREGGRGEERKGGETEKDGGLQMPNRSLASLRSSVGRSRADLGVSLFELQCLASVPYESTLCKSAWWQRPVMPVTWEA